MEIHVAFYWHKKQCNKQMQQTKKQLTFFVNKSVSAIKLSIIGISHLFYSLVLVLIGR